MISMMLDMPDWFESLLEGIVKALYDVFKWLVQLFMPFLYYLATSCFSILDLCQLMFRYLAGLEAYKLNGGELITGDLFFRLFEKTFLTGSLRGGMWGTDGEYSVLAVAFWSLVIIASLLLLVTTIAAIIRIEYNPDKEKKNSKSGILKNFFKALASFAIVPIASYFGLRLGNAVLFAIDSATSSQISSTLTTQDVKGSFVATNGSYSYFISGGLVTKISGSSNTIAMKYPSISGLVNKVCLYDANRARTEGGFYESHIANGGDLSLGVFDKPSGQGESAQLIDDAFSLNAKLSDDSLADGGYMNRNNRDLVKLYYNLSNYNIILAAIYIFMGGKAIIGLTFGLISRVITLLGLLFIEPLALGVMPVDNGTAFGEWRKHYIARIISVFMALIAMNVFYIVCPIFLTIEFFPTALAWANGVVQVIFIIALLGSVAKLDVLFNKVFSGEKIGADAAVSAGGASILADTKTAVGQVGRVARAGIGLGVGLAKTGVRATIGAVSGGFALGSGIAQQVNRNRRNKAQAAGNQLNDKMKGLEGKANKTNASIFGDAAGKQYDKLHDDKMQEAYDKYSKKAGDKAMSFDDWKEKTGEGSYMAAKQSGMGLREYYNKTHVGGSEDDYKKWRKEGLATNKQFKEAGIDTSKKSGKDLTATGAENNFKKTYGTREEFAKNNEDIMTGKKEAKTEYEKAMASEAQAAIKERDEAKKEYDSLKAERDKQKASADLYEAKRAGAKKFKMASFGYMRENAGKMFKHAGDSFGSIGNLFNKGQ